MEAGVESTTQAEHTSTSQHLTTTEKFGSTTTMEKGIQTTQILSSE